ncbi:MAG: oligosaccharide flippase family protein [Clostridia bacterium]|nr:oligosaccharide flippase family protein [Clostridia bacterium]
MQNGFHNEVLKATKWSVMAEIAAKLAAPIVNIILARLLVPDEFGIVASITIITSFADIFTDAGFQKFIVQHEFEDVDSLNKYSDVAFTANAVLSVLIFSIVFCFRRSLAAAVQCAEAYNGLVVAALSILCTSFSSISIARFRKNLNFKPIFYIRIGSSLVPLLVTVPLAFAFKNYWALVIGSVCQQLFIAVMAVAFSTYKPRLRLNMKMFSDMVFFSLWNLMETLSIWFAGQANIFIVANVLNSYYLGLYKTGMATINSYLSIITASISPVLFSALSRAQNDTETYRNTFYKFQKIMSMLVLPLGVGIFLYRDLAVLLLLGSQWGEIADFMGLWALISAFTITFSNTACEVYRSMGKPKISFVLQMIYLIIYIPVVYWSARAGFRVLCYAGCFVRLFPVLLDFITLSVFFGISFRSLLKNTYTQIIAVAVMAAVGVLCQHAENAIAWQFFSILICAATYVIALLLFPDTRRELRSAKDLIRHKERIGVKRKGEK